MSKPHDGDFTKKEAQARFEAALKSALNTPHTPLKDKPKKRVTSKRQAKKKPAKS
jgi:hypothetical protein